MIIEFKPLDIDGSDMWTPDKYPGDGNYVVKDISGVEYCVILKAGIVWSFPKEDATPYKEIEIPNVYKNELNTRSMLTEDLLLNVLSVALHKTKV